MKQKHVVIGILLLSLAMGCKTSERTAKSGDPVTYPAMGALEKLDAQFDTLIAPDAKIEKLAEGYDWSEGPVWVRDGAYLLFSDVPTNTVFKWKEGEGAKPFLKPSGYTGSTPRVGEPGSNGLTVDPQGRLVLCQHGDR